MNAGKRRIGLSKKGFNGPSLHGGTINNAGNSRSGSSSGPVQKGFKPADGDEDVNRSPQGSDNEDIEFSQTDFKIWPNSPQLTKQNLKDNNFNAVREETVLSMSSEAQIGSSPRSSSSTKDAAGSQAKKIRTDPAKEEQTPDILFGILKTQNKKRPKTAVKYGAKHNQSKREMRASGDSPVSSFKLPPDNLDITSPHKEFRVYDPELELDSPIEKATFKPPQGELSPDQSPAVRRFKPPEPLESPFGEGANTIFKVFEITDSPFKERRIPEFINREIADSFEDEPSSLDIEFISPTTFISPGNGEESQSQAPVFRTPYKIEEILSDSHTKQLDISTEPFDDLVPRVDDSIREIDHLAPKFDQATCPMCGDDVDPGFLRIYNNGNQMNVRMQMRFCRAHKKKSARDTWISLGYPTIDWESLDERIAKHHHFLQNLLNGASSHYRDSLSESVKSGKNRTLKQSMLSSDMPVGPGYYGSRGLRAMSENIMNKFSPQLRKIAIKDRLVAARGVIGYVQAVLVPELATRLIGEDMGVSAKQAREIMGESVGLGDLLNDELQDVVVVGRSDDD